MINSSLISYALSILSLIGLRILCVSHGLDFFSLCPSYTINGDRLTLFTLLNHIVYGIFPVSEIAALGSLQISYSSSIETVDF
jgi:hypothetical protein